MSIIAVMNRKGGSGKSTLATHIAAWCASTGASVMLGNTDKQRSAQAWLSRRSLTAATISTWPSDLGRTFRAVQGHTYVVVDTPGGIQGLDLAKHLARVDAIVVPVGPSIFDLETSVDFFHELFQHPRVSSGRCQVAVVGMRWPREMAEVWQSNDMPTPLPLLTVIPDAPIYRSCLDSGSSLFDETADAPSSDLRHWRPLLDWLERLPKVPDPVDARLAAAERNPPQGVHAALASRSPGRHRPTHLRLRSPEAFIETRPPDGVGAAELNAAGVPAPRQDLLQKGHLVDLGPVAGTLKVIGHAQRELSLRPALTASTAGSGRSVNSWLARLFKPR